MRRTKNVRLRRAFIIIGSLVLILLGVVIGIEKNMFDSEKRATTKLLYYHSPGVIIPWLPQTVKQFSDDIDKQAKRYNIDANFIAILMTLESGGYVKADSGFAKGLLQITPSTANDIATKHLLKPVSTYDLFNPKTSIEFGVSYAAWLRDNYCVNETISNSNECAESIAAGYNGGPGAIIDLQSGKGLNNDETAIYSRNAFMMWREKSANKSPTFERWYAAGGKRLIESAEKD